MNKIDLPLILFPVVALLVVLLFDPGYFASIFLFYFFPAAYLAAVNFKRIGIQGIVFSFLIAIPFFVVVDYIGTVSRLWRVPSSIFSSKIFGILPIEDYIWLAAAALFSVAIYAKNKAVSWRGVWVLFVGSLLALAVFVFFLVKVPGTLIWSGKFAYLFIGSIFFLIPALILLIKHPKLFQAQLKPVLYFLCITSLFEFTATYYGYWEFSGNYILKPISFGGFGYVPFEELFFVGMVGPFAAAYFYENFIQLSKKR